MTGVEQTGQGPPLKASKRHEDTPPSTPKVQRPSLAGLKNCAAVLEMREERREKREERGDEEE